MKYILLVVIAVGLLRSFYRFIKARHLADGLFFLFWLTLGIAGFTQAPFARLIAIGFLIGAFVLDRRSPRSKISVSPRGHDEEVTIDIEPSSEVAPEPEPDSAEFIGSIPEYAETCVAHAKILTSDTLDYTPESLATLDEMITKGWDGEPPALLDQMTVIFGSYVGETIRRNLGGKWEHSEEFGYTLVEIGGNDLKAFPFNKTHKRFVDGEGDSVAFLYRAIKHTLEKGSDSADE